MIRLILRYIGMFVRGMRSQSRSLVRRFKIRTLGTTMRGERNDW